MDASNGMSSIIEFIVNGLKFCFDFLDSFTFAGISMLDFMITIFVIGAVLPIILALVNTRSPDDTNNMNAYFNSSKHNRGVDE